MEERFEKVVGRGVVAQVAPSLVVPGLCGNWSERL